MSIPYEKSFDLPACESGQDNHFELRFPGRGTLIKLIAVQASGAAAGFTVDIYNSQRPMVAAGAEEGSGSSETAADFDASNYKILPTQDDSETPGKIELLGNYHEYPYVNRDGGPTDNFRKVYARVRPTGTGAKDFQLTLGMLPPEL